MLVTSSTKRPGNLAIEHAGATLTYAQLRAAVDAFSAHLTALGLGRGDPLIILLPNGAEIVVAVFAAARLGSIAVPVNLAFQMKEMQYYLENSQAKAVVTNEGLAEKHGSFIKGVVPDCQIITDVLDDNAELQETSAPRVPFDDDFLYQYSSGTTGTPKRVVRTQACLVQEATQYANTLNLSADDKILAVVPIAHSYGFGNCLLVSIRAGATLHALDSFNRRHVVDALVDNGITVFPGVPFMFGILADSHSIKTTHFPALRLAYTAGGPLAKKTFDGCLEKFGIPVRQHYGSTETGPISINLGSVDGDLWASVGQPVQQVEFKVVDKNGGPVGVDQIGDIVIRSKSAVTAYADSPEEAQRAFSGGYFWSGDLGKIDSNGNLFITGRKTLFINVGGHKVDPAEIEAVINEHPGVSETVVLGVASNHGQEVIKAVIVCSETCEPDEIKNWCKGKVADFKIPRMIEFREEIPRSPLGKIQRKYMQD